MSDPRPTGTTARQAGAVTGTPGADGLVPAGPVADGPLVARTRTELRTARASLAGGDVAVVMTMGALHEGHATLIHQARKAHRHVVVTIFLNPLQFGPKEDLSRYPRTFDTDLEICTAAGVDLVFAPTPDVIYQDGDPGVRISAGPLGNVLEGQARPGHFDGMLTVVAKLLHLSGADSAYFGQKDAQQVVVIKRMVRDLDLDLEIRVLPTIRGEDGLALSSRNVHLSGEEREAALALPRALQARDRSLLNGLEVDYFEEADFEPRVLAAAVRVGKTRLIDNVVIEEGARR